MNIIALVLFIALISSMWLFPSGTFALGIIFLLFSLAIAIQSIFKKHKGTKNPRPKIAKDVLLLVVTLLIIVFFGGLAGMFANYYIGLYFGQIVGFVSAIVASLVVGFLVKKGVLKLFR